MITAIEKANPNNTTDNDGSPQTVLDDFCAFFELNAPVLMIN